MKTDLHCLEIMQIINAYISHQTLHYVKNNFESYGSMQNTSPISNDKNPE